MKNPLVIALLILAVLGGAVWYTNQNPPAEDEEDSVTLIDVEDSQVAEVTIQRRDAEPITLTRPDGEDQWRFGGGIDFPADNNAVGLMVTNLANLSADRVVNEETTDWSPYDLEGDGTIAVDVELRDLEDAEAATSRRILFGRETPTGSGIYARLEGDPRLYTVFNYVRATFDKEIFDWRDKKLLQADEETVERIRLDLGDREFEFGKSGEADWSILEPQELRADNFTVGDLARSLRTAEMTTVVEEDAPSFDRPLARATIVDAGGEHELTLIQDGDRYLARSSDQDGVYEVSATLAESLDKSLEDFRQKKLFDFGFAPLAKLTIRSGETSATLEKDEGAWKLASEGGREVSAEKAQTLIDALRNLTAIGFPSDEASAQARFGLNSPAIEAEALSADEGSSPERIALSDLSKDRVYAARPGEPSTYEVEKAPAEEVSRALEELLAPEQASEGETPPEEE